MYPLNASVYIKCRHVEIVCVNVRIPHYISGVLSDMITECCDMSMEVFILMLHSVLFSYHGMGHKHGNFHLTSTGTGEYLASLYYAKTDVAYNLKWVGLMRWRRGITKIKICGQMSDGKSIYFECSSSCGQVVEYL